MKRFLVGLLVGGATVWLMKVDDKTREELLDRTDELAAGRTNPLRLLQKNIEAQRERLRAAVEIGKRAAEERQRELWAELELTRPDKTADGYEEPAV